MSLHRDPCKALMLALIVETHASLRSSLERVVLRHGHRVEVTSSPELALRALRDRRPDVVILDGDAPDPALLNRVRHLGIQRIEMVSRVGRDALATYVRKPLTAGRSR